MISVEKGRQFLGRCQPFLGAKSIKQILYCYLSFEYTAQSWDMPHYVSRKDRNFGRYTNYVAHLRKYCQIGIKTSKIRDSPANIFKHSGFPNSLTLFKASTNKKSAELIICAKPKITCVDGRPRRSSEESSTSSSLYIDVSADLVFSNWHSKKLTSGMSCVEG